MLSLLLPFIVIGFAACHQFTWDKLISLVIFCNLSMRLNVTWKWMVFLPKNIFGFSQLPCPPVSLHGRDMFPPWRPKGSKCYIKTRYSFWRGDWQQLQYAAYLCCTIAHVLDGSQTYFLKVPIFQSQQKKCKTKEKHLVLRLIFSDPSPHTSRPLLTKSHVCSRRLNVLGC